MTEQHNSKPFLDSAAKEQNMANRKIETLTSEGKIPPRADAVVSDKDPIDQKYDQFCSACHGAAGDGKGAGAAGLTPKPRDFTDAKWQASVNDDRIAKVIKEGGASVGLAATMAPWGSVLQGDELTLMVKKVRKFKK